MLARRPLEIINGPLMKGMDEVGRLFNANQMIVAEVLQSAEAMKAAVAHLEPYMEKSEGLNKGTIVLATVKGDVHDIGKNLVDIILSNNGYRIINLGIKVPPEELIKACARHQPDAIGLSGLLVKSAQMMVITAQDLKAAGVRCPMLVGGAALSSRFTRLKIAPEYDGPVAYANDAMKGLDLANQLMDPQRREALVVELDEQARKLAATAGKVRDVPIAPVRRRSAVQYDGPIPQPPDLKAPSDSRLRPGGDFQLHQSGDALHAPSRASRISTRRWRRAIRKRWNCARWSPVSKTRCWRIRKLARERRIVFSPRIPMATGR